MTDRGDEQQPTPWDPAGTRPKHDPESLLPTADPIGAPVWETNGRFDLRLHETTTFGVSLSAIDREARRTQVSGRAELRAFF